MVLQLEFNLLRAFLVEVDIPIRNSNSVNKTSLIRAKSTSNRLAEMVILQSITSHQSILNLLCYNMTF
jgi:hypothetical protein